MNPYRIILVLFFTLSAVLAKADAAPKLHPQLEIEFTQNDKIVTDFDSIHVVCHLTNGQLDTLFLSEPWYNDNTYLTTYNNHFGWHWPGLGSNYVLEFLHPVRDFQIFLIHDGNVYNSEIISFTGARSFQEFELTNGGKIVDNHNLFYTHWSYYFISLAVTLILECLIALVLFRTMRGQFGKFLLVILCINFLTHPILWFVDSRIHIPLWVLEIGVIFLEIIALKFVYRKVLKIGTCIFVGVLANLTSWWIGGIIAYLLYEMFGR